MYDLVRDEIKTGDLISWHTTSPKIIPYLIRRTTNKERRLHEVDNDISVNHVSGVLRLPLYELGDRRWVVEAVSGGVEITLLSCKLENHKGTVYWYPVEATDEERAQWGSNALVNIGKRYGFLDIVKYLLMGAPEIDIKRGLYCSEAWLHCWGDQGKGWSPNGLPANVGRLKNSLPVVIKQ